MKIKDMPEDSKPRERLLKFGIENLSNAELLALVLEKGTRQENVIEISNRLINQFGIGKLSECSLKELQEINGVGQAKAMQILALFEINKRNSIAAKETKKIKSSKDVFELYQNRLKDKKQENFFVLMLDNKNKIIGEEMISRGILDSAILHPREVFKPAIKNSSSRIILVHNHPSGDSSPSREDLEITKILIEAGELLGIQVLDHVIIGNDYWSWQENENRN